MPHFLPDYKYSGISHSALLVISYKVVTSHLFPASSALSASDSTDTLLTPSCLSHSFSSPPHSAPGASYSYLSSDFSSWPIVSRPVQLSFRSLYCSTPSCLILPGPAPSHRSPGFARSVSAHHPPTVLPPPSAGDPRICCAAPA